VAPSVFGSASSLSATFRIRVDTTGLTALANQIDRISQTFGNAFDRVMADETNKAVKRIQVRWPVDTGRSRGLGLWTGQGWQWGRPSRFSYVIFNPQPYVIYIRPKGGGPLLVDTVVVQETVKARKAIADKGRKILGRAMSRQATITARRPSGARIRIGG